MNWRMYIISRTDCTGGGHGYVHPRRLLLGALVDVSGLLPQIPRKRIVDLIRIVG